MSVWWQWGRGSVPGYYAVLVLLAPVAGGSAQIPASSQGLSGTLQEVAARQGMPSAQLDRLLHRALLAEREQQWPIAADDLAIAVVAAPRFSLRDTLLKRLRTVLQKPAPGVGPANHTLRDTPIDAALDTLLDRAFQQVYDTQIPVTPAVPATSGRTVLAEYVTGTQCGVCWEHDRLYAAVRQRYPLSDVIVLAYHDGPGYPIAFGGDHLWSAIASAGDVPTIKGLYTLTSAFGVADFGWIDGHSVTPDTQGTAGMLLNPQTRPPAEAFTALVTPAIERRRQQAPGARIDMTLTPHVLSDTELATVSVQVQVTPLEEHQHLGVRLVLVEDTVRVTGFTNRRLQYAAVRTVAWFGHPRTLFSRLPAGVRTPTTVRYTFDVAALQRALFRTWARDADAHAAFPDQRTWRMQPRRLGVVAIVQDLDTKDVLQAAYQRIMPPAK